MYTTQLETLRMEEDEEVSQFIAMLSNLVNVMRSLGEDILESKVVWKVLRSLPKRFTPKVTAIEESNDLEALKIEELIGSVTPQNPYHKGYEFQHMKLNIHSFILNL